MARVRKNAAIEAHVKSRYAAASGSKMARARDERQYRARDRVRQGVRAVGQEEIVQPAVDNQRAPGERLALSAREQRSFAQCG